MFGRPMIAIDIGSSAIKVVEMTGAKQKKLSAIGLEVLPPGAVVDGVIQNQDAVEQVLKELLKKLKLSTRGRRAALSLGGSSVLIKKIAVAAKDGTDLSEQVYYEAEQHFQSDMAEIYFDFTELGPAAGMQGEPGPNGPEKPVLIVGARREMVEQYIAAVHSCGMRTGVVECDVFSTANMFEYNYGIVEALAAVINVGATSTQVSVLARGEYVFTRDVAIGGEEYSRQIMDAVGVDRDNAEALKVALSQGDHSVPREVGKVLGAVNEQLVAEIQVSLDYFLQSGDPAAQDASIVAAFLTGGGSRVLGLDAALASALHMQVKVLNPFQRVDINPRKFQMDYILMQGHLYGVAVGLGLRAPKDNV